MIKLIGAAVILLATTWAGFEYARRLSERPRHLRLFRNSFQVLEAEIMYGHVPLQEAAWKLSKQIPGHVGVFWGDFARGLMGKDATVKSAWESSLKTLQGEAGFREAELEVLSQFGETLGRHDRHQQQKQILLTTTHLEREEEDALQTKQKYEKMAKSLGFLSGLLLIVLLI
ncbi:MAG: stage III sporulation protein SpoIIIAB [Bacillus sp. (in: firmicutes)]